MCGLFSIFPKEGADALSLRILAMFLGVGNVPRGRHSYGMWAKGIAPLRGLGAINDADNALNFRNFIFTTWDPGAGNWIAGHTRQATHGGRTLENCHPFQVGNLTLAHNGVVTVEGYTDKEHAVDSGRIALSVVEHGWVDGLAKVSGSCALVCSIDDNLMLYRHNQVLHMVDEPWGWAISSEKSTLLEAIIMAGLSCTGEPEEITSDHVIAPWDGVSQRCPAKAYTAPASAYKGGEWIGGRWVRDEEESDTFYGTVWDDKTRTYVKRQPSKTTTLVPSGGVDPKLGQCNGKDHPPLFGSSSYGRVKEEEAKDRFLSPAKGTSAEINTPECIERAAKMLVSMGGVNKQGVIKLGDKSAIRDQVIRWSIEGKRFENDLIFMADPDTKITTQHIAALKVTKSWYDSQTGEQKDRLWFRHYATLLTNIGVTTPQYQKALADYDKELDKVQGEYRTCDWCNLLRELGQLKTRTFGNDTIEVCDYCDSDFKAARRGMDFRENRSSVRDARRKMPVGN